MRCWRLRRWLRWSFAIQLGIIAEMSFYVAVFAAVVTAISTVVAEWRGVLLVIGAALVANSLCVRVMPRERAD